MTEDGKRISVFRCSHIVVLRGIAFCSTKMIKIVLRFERRSCVYSFFLRRELQNARSTQKCLDFDAKIAVTGFIGQVELIASKWQSCFRKYAR